MAATAWNIYNKAKRHLGVGNFAFSADVLKVALFQSASNASTFSLSTLASVTSQVTAANGYTAGGKTASAHTWTTGASAKEYRLDCTAIFWSANGGSIANVKYAVLYDDTHASDLLIAWTRLSTAQFDVTDTNRLTVTPADPAGLFELN